MSKDKDPWWIRYAASIITRALYFVVVCGFCLCTAWRCVGWDTLAYNPMVYVAGCAALGLLAAIVGPYVYQAETERGRGSLEEIRRKSRRLW